MEKGDGYYRPHRQDRNIWRLGRLFRACARPYRTEGVFGFAPPEIIRPKFREQMPRQIASPMAMLHGVTGLALSLTARKACSASRLSQNPLK